MKSNKAFNINNNNNVAGCTDLSGKELHRQVGVDIEVTSGSLSHVMVSRLAQNARDVGLISALGIIFPIFITPTTLIIIKTTN